jgi:uracil-DNA glycosylase
MTRDQLRNYLSFYRDLGVTDVYRDARATEPGAAQGSSERKDRFSSAMPDETPPNQATPNQTTLNQAPPYQATSYQNPARKAAEARQHAAAVSQEDLPPLAPDDDSLEKIQQDIGPDCRRCRLCEGRSKIVFGSGNPRARLVFVGEGPGADEDAQGLPFVGRAGQLLTQMIENTAAKEGIPIRRPDVYICNVVKCRPPENRTPEPDEMEMCGQFLFRQLMAIRPRAICALGSTAAKALLATKDGVTRLRGRWHKWHDIPLMVTFHPSYLLRPYNQNAKREAWEDLKTVLHYVYD